jgi:glycolate oxidase FAD binding subunit
MPSFRPSNAAETAELVAWASGDSVSLEIVAGGSKRGLGRPVQTDHVLDLSALSGIIDYEPSELVLTAQAATPMAEIKPLLAAHNQMLAFEPPDWRRLLGGGGEPTLGGVIACNLAGPRRVRAGAARDHFLGFTGVNGWGDVWKSGSRVVKNVTGYDMCKLQSGAYGTLSVLTEISVKVMPRPETECSLVLPGLYDAAAIRLMAQALNSEHEVSAAAYLPSEAAAWSRVVSSACAVVRLEGPAPSVSYRAGVLEGLLGRSTLLEAAESQALWTEIGAVAPLVPVEGGCVWRLCPTPSAAAGLYETLRSRLKSAVGFYDWGGGLIWLSVAESEAGADGAAAVVRRAMKKAGGHATLVRAPAEVRAAVDVFEPLSGPLAALSGRVKVGFDPRGILNPGRLQKDF